MDGRKPEGTLRRGWTTGACAAAAAAAALKGLLSGRFPEGITIELPRGQTPTFSLETTRLADGVAMASVIKDAGDDPDVTHGAQIIAEVRHGASGEGVKFEAGGGVGTVTLPGLPLAVGEPAINPAPRRIIINNLTRIAKAHHAAADVVVRISMVDVDDGTVYLSDWFGPGDENDKTTEVTIPCSVGKRWDSGSGECVACSAGKFGIGKGDCSYSVANCSAGYYCGGSGGAATKCPSGKYGNVTGKSVESEACLYSCGASTYGTAAGQTTASAACSPCPIGFFCSGGSNRVPCPAGKWGAVASQASEANACPNDCPSGKFASSTFRLSFADVSKNITFPPRS